MPKLIVEYITDKGYGVIAGERILAGQFICEYLG